MSKEFAAFQSLMGKITTIYVLCIFILFPLYFTDAYFNVLQDKTVFFFTLTAITVGVMLIFGIYYLCRYIKNHKITFPKYSSIKESIRTHFSQCDAFFIIFLIILALSTFLSTYTEEALSGSSGRYQGLYLWLAYAAAYFVISRFYRPKRIHFEIFACVGALFCLWAVTDYINVDILGWIAQIKKAQRGQFSSAFGNINTCTQGFALYYAASCVLYITTKKEDKKEKIFNALFIVITTCGLIVGQSDNAVIGLVAVLTVIPFIFIKNYSDIKKYLEIILLSGLSFPIIYLITESFNPVYAGYDSGILLNISEHPGFVLALLLIPLIFCGIIFYTERNYEQDSALTINVPFVWGIICVIGVIFVVFLFMDAASNPEKYEALSNFLIFDDHWGTNRGMIWRMTGEEFSTLPSIQKLIGTGPETFGIIMTGEYRSEMVAIAGQVFDSPHNELLQYLFTTGLLGTLAYYEIFLFGFDNGVHSESNLFKASSVILITYVAVSFVSISVPIIFPFVIVFLAITQCQGEDKEKVLRKKKQKRK